MLSNTDLNRRDFLKLTAAFSAGALLRPQDNCFGASSVNQTSPNIIYVFADQMRASALGHTPDGDPVQTPHLSRFAGEGLELTHAASTFPVCSPHRAMLLTGCYPSRNNVGLNINSDPQNQFELRDDQVCVTDVLAQSGYNVAYIGKWHLTKPFAPLLDEFRLSWDGNVWNEYTRPESRHGITFWHAYNTYDKHLRPMYWSGSQGRHEYEFVDQWSPEHEADVAIDYLRKQKEQDKPFALFVSFNPPHPPFHEVPEKYREIYGDATAADLLKRKNVSSSEKSSSTEASRSVLDYFAMISGVDEQFGRILSEVSRLGLENNTLVVFTSDHGEMMGSHGLMGKNIWYDESFRVPLLVRFPDRLKGGQKNNLLLNTPDIPATLLGLLGLESRIPDQWQGADHSRCLTDSSGGYPEYQLYWNNYDQSRGIRTLRHTCVLPQGSKEKEAWVLQEPVLYDNLNDPWQVENLAAEKKQMVRDFAAITDELCRGLGDTWSS